MSPNMPKMFSPELKINSIKIEDFKIKPINPGGSENFKPLTRNVLKYAQDIKKKHE